MLRTNTIGLLLAATVTAMLAGCGQPVPPALKPLSAEAKALLAQKGMREDSPLFVRIFKEESELEVWKVADDGQYRLFKTYPICKWSGELGPKLQQGDLQAPEGFYQVRASQMNPNSNYYLSFNLGFPNTFDKAHDRTGAHLMVHGDCKSAGCYAMTDALIEEIYILAREAFKSGQEEFNVHAFPFRMTDENMRRHRGSKWYGFWRNLKEGYEYFEQAKRPPAVKVCERRYLVNAAFLDKSTAVDPRGVCPPFRPLPIEALPPPPLMQEAMSRPADARPTGSIAAASTPARAAIQASVASSSAAGARPDATAGARASIKTQASAAEPSGTAAAAASSQSSAAQPATAPVFTPAAQATVGQGTTFQFAPSYPSASSQAFRLNSMLGRP